MTRKPRAVRDPIVMDPNGGDDGADPIAREAWERWRLSSEHLRDALAEARENYDFLAGNQWSTDDMASLKEKQRPIIVFNRVQATLSAVSGYEINGRQEVTYLPRTPEDSGEAEVDTQAAKYFRQECDAEDEESEQFRDMLTGGYGWIEHRMDYDEDPDGMLKVERVDMFEMRYDPAAMRPNITDRSWDIRGRWWDKKKAQAKWPGHNFDVPSPTIDPLDLDNIPTIDRLAAAFYASPSTGDVESERKNKVFILEYTWFEMEAFHTVLNPTTGKTEDVAPRIHARFQERLAELGMPPARSVKRERRRYKRAFVHARTTLDDGPAPCPDHFHYQTITGYRNRNKNTWFGMVSLMKDPQRWANKWLSQFLHQLNTNVNTGTWYEKGAFESPAEVERKVAKPGFMQGIERGFFDKVRKEEPGQIPQDAFNLVTYAVNAVRDSTGANLEIMGQQTNDQSGVLEAHRKQSAMNVLAPMFAAQRQYRKMSGRITLYFIRTFLSDGRFIRIAGPANAKYVSLAKREDSAKYDIIVDQSPSSPNQKEMVFGTLSMILPALMKMGIPVPPEIVDYVPGLPAQLAEKWKQLVEDKAKQPPPPDPKTALAQQKLQQEAVESANQDRLDQQRLAFDKMKLMVERLMQEREERMQREKLALDRDKLASHEREHLASASTDIILQHHDHRHEHRVAEADRAHERSEAAVDREHASREGAEDRKVSRETSKQKEAH